MKKYLLLIGLAGLLIQCQAQDKLKQLLESRSDLFDEILKNKHKYKLQIIYTQIDRDAQNKPSFKTYKFNVNQDNYFYPASMVKFPASLLALEKINNLKIKDLNKYSYMKIEASRKPQTKMYVDTTAKYKKPSLAHFIKKIFVVSDNPSFTRLYEFLGQKYINERLWAKGYKNIQVLHRLERGFGVEDNRHTNQMSFYNPSGQTLYTQNAQYNPKKYTCKIKNPYVAKSYYKWGNFYPKPLSFRNKNYFALEDMHEMLKAVMFPESVPTHKRFNLTKDDYRFLYKCMSMLPRESNYPKYTKDYEKDGMVKYFIYGDLLEEEANKSKIPDNVRIFNKVGLSYGFLVDNAYIVDFEAKVEFLLSAVMYVNEDEILNNDKYEYEKIGFPFFRNLGKVIMWHEKNRKRTYKPDLSKFKVAYWD